MGDNNNNLFQFHEGPIKTCTGGNKARCVGSFNSMKVRLKRAVMYVLISNKTGFQFHEGPIKTMAG